MCVVYLTAKIFEMDLLRFIEFLTTVQYFEYAAKTEPMEIAAI
jgi:hypothetical protein